ncbi:MAG: hypothetical protein HC900_05620, partial [Methylacidiphilales bacterium]|nr:hypothetical protein [Candidatus Methylacidiphilales bacterium]
MTKRRGLYKEYIQILPAAESGTMVPVVSVEGYVGLRALSTADAPEPPSEGTGDRAAEPAPAVEPPALTAPMV